MTAKISRRASLGLLALGATARAARAAEWPADRAVTCIVPFPAGGGVDVMARVVLQAAAAHIPGCNFVVENRVGAAGQIGFEAVFRAAPDGFTIGCITTPAVNTIAIERRVGYRVPDFTFLANVVDDPGSFFVRPDSPLKTLADLRDAAKKDPESLAYGTAGVGSDDHLLGLAFEDAAGVKLAHIPYNGTPPIITDLLGGRLAFGSLNMGEGFALMKEGRIRPLAQAGAQRWSAAPDVPTFREAGFDVVGGSARGIVAPPDLPAPIRDKLLAALGAAMQSDHFKAEAARLNLPLRPLLGDSYKQFVLQNDTAAHALWQKHPWRE